MVIPQKMKAAVLTERNHLEVQEVKTPKPGPAEVLIKVEACADLQQRCQPHGQTVVRPTAVREFHPRP